MALSENIELAEENYLLVAHSTDPGKK